MKNLRILYAGPATAALAIGEVFAAANLVAAGFRPTDLIARGDAEETDDDPTSEFHVEADELAAAEAHLAGQAENTGTTTDTAPAPDAPETTGDAATATETAPVVDEAATEGAAQ